MNYVEWPLQLGDVRNGIRVVICKRELNYRRRVYHSAIAFTKPTGPGRNGLLADFEIIAIRAFGGSANSALLQTLDQNKKETNATQRTCKESKNEKFGNTHMSGGFGGSLVATCMSGGAEPTAIGDLAGTLWELSDPWR